MRNEMQASLAQCAARVDAAYAEFSQAQAESERKIQELLAANMSQTQKALAHSERELKTQLSSGLGDLLATVNQKTAEQHADLEQQRTFFEHELQQTSQDLIDRVEQAAASMRENQEALARATGQLRADMSAKLGGVLATVDRRTAEQQADLEQQRTVFERELKQTSQDLMQQVEQAAASMRENQEALVRAEGQLRTETIAKLDNLLAVVNQKIAAQHDDLERQRTFVERELQQAAQDSIHRINAAQAAQASNSRKTGWAVAAAAGLSLLSLGWQVVSHISAG
jgi:hypothetical protein